MKNVVLIFLLFLIILTACNNEGEDTLSSTQDILLDESSQTQTSTPDQSPLIPTKQKMIYAQEHIHQIALSNNEVNDIIGNKQYDVVSTKFWDSSGQIEIRFHEPFYADREWLALEHPPGPAYTCDKKHDLGTRIQQKLKVEWLRISVDFCTEDVVEIVPLLRISEAY